MNKPASEQPEHVARLSWEAYEVGWDEAKAGLPCVAPLSYISYRQQAYRKGWFACRDRMARGEEV